MATKEEVEAVCGHLDEAREVAPESPDSCPECVELGDTWVQLRLCTSCGHIGCCDSSKNRHASAHNAATSHPIIRSYEPRQAWWYCYPDEFGFEIDGVGPVRSA